MIVLALALALFILVASFVLVGLAGYGMRQDAGQDEVPWTVQIPSAAQPVHGVVHLPAFSDPGRVRVCSVVATFPDECRR